MIEGLKYVVLVWALALLLVGFEVWALGSSAACNGCIRIRSMVRAPGLELAGLPRKRRSDPT